MSEEKKVEPKKYADLCLCMHHLIKNDLLFVQNTIDRTTGEEGLITSLKKKKHHLFVAFCPMCGTPTTYPQEAKV